MPCSRCGSAHVRHNSVVQNTENASHIGLHVLKHSPLKSHPLGLVALGGIALVNWAVDQFAKSSQCEKCGHKF